MDRGLANEEWPTSQQQRKSYATQQCEGSEAIGAGVRLRWCPYNLGRVEAPSYMTAIDIAPLQKCSKCEHGTAGSAKDTEAVPIEAAVGVLRRRCATAATIPKMTASPLTAVATPIGSRGRPMTPREVRSRVELWHLENLRRCFKKKHGRASESASGSCQGSLRRQEIFTGARL